MTHEITVLLFSHLTILFTTIAGFVFAWLREGRRHRWQEDQFRQMRDEVKNNGHDR
jgi:uncharacterized membrane protein affecting hemolysin expression